MLNSKHVKILALLIASITAGPSIANGLNENSNTLSVDNGVVLQRSGDSASEEPVVVSSAKGNHTATAGASANARSSDNPAVDGINVQPVPNAIVQPVRLTDDVIPSRQDLIVEPGVNTLIPISIGQLNRIVTPFERPTVQRLQLSDVKVSVQGNVIYVSTSSTNPVALYISEKGDESVALSLSLVPQKIAPVQASLMLSRKVGNNPAATGYTQNVMYGGNETKARKWEQKDNYVETIRNILRAVALGDIPPGYAMGSLGRGHSIPNCNFSTGTAQDNVKYSFAGGQYIQGSQFSVIVGVAQNTGASTITVDESLCTHPNLAARALWSRNTLQPGQKTEAYFVIRNQSQQAQVDDSVRPKLAE
ncbi:TraK domain-containing protein [Morganella morganii]|uniref:TraK domain-containing protein n=1 Tax=Providencia huaxiensis TaxID=2027290 RepID=UPI002ADEA45E|nr:type-F conjugative transfer system secretin TraK [Morganella morganii]